VYFGKVTNTLQSAQIRYKADGADTWSDWTSVLGVITSQSGEYKAEEQAVSGLTFTLGTAYTIELKIADELSSVTRTASLNSGKPLYSAVQNEGIAIGGLYDKETGGELQVIGDIDISGNATIDGTLQYGPTRNDYHDAGFTHDQYGNMKHKRDTSTDIWSMQSNAGSNVVSVYPETGRTDITGTLYINNNEVLGWTLVDEWDD